MYPRGHAITPMSRFGAAILGCEGTALSGAERRFFADANPFGFILFARNIEAADQIRALTADLRDTVGWNAPVFIDQEGGRVQRLRPPLARDWPAPLDHVARFGPKAARVMYLRYRIIAAELLSLGIDANCAPMLDIARPQTHKFLRNRCYGSDLETVVGVGRAVAQGLLDGGVYPVIKHIPGHGLAQIDSHLDVPRVTDPVATLEKADFAAFRPFSDMTMGMTAHLIYEHLSDEPATQSAKMIAMIRGQIGFDGLLMTDDISMEALDGPVWQRGRRALDAGCDVVLHCNGDLREMIALMRSTGTMTDAAQMRADAALAARPTSDSVDIAALDAQLEALEAERGHE
ncbi:glycoside hydrolase family 3 N-terminal domain-containing protein [Pseudoprimorskyibacter insulae]|uniref:beta-N-acetylhexosaminidase n=1 Tax=Pseudoprimorskyibacter insulae TaxID=1695997 RepID=A0A2R8AW99_9RHOB|nr:glycoside hydrolase family 3 N-terminal domain-containing protein [Pseudoprimorskyibacter insulae]SPF80303.1 Beta-hexosaminidase [Pseudoprimorskyibacter insulae]